MFVFPMVGLSSRFFEAGYKVPKYQLLIKNNTVFHHVISSFKKYFVTDKFVFIYRNIYNTENFLINEIKKTSIKNFDLVRLNDNTYGQAETVFRGLEKIYSDEEIFIFNIDTFRPNFKRPNLISSCDGYLEVFLGSGKNWSYVKGNVNGDVFFTAEKEEISNMCCSGLYYFKKASFFKEAFLDSYRKKKLIKGEYYVAPLYNYLIKKKLNIKYNIIPKKNIVFCGTPDEFELLVKENRTWAN